jgi:hypothetical protein
MSWSYISRWKFTDSYGACARGIDIGCIHDGNTLPARLICSQGSGHARQSEPDDNLGLRIWRILYFNLRHPQTQGDRHGQRSTKKQSGS